MTERIDMGRFHWDRALEKIIDYETCESYYDDECVEILNDINYQNFKLEKENKKLKDEVYGWKASAEDYLKLGKSLLKENKELKDLLKSMADRNNEIWLDNGQIIRLKKVFNGEWTND